LQQEPSNLGKFETETQALLFREKLLKDRIKALELHVGGDSDDTPQYPNNPIVRANANIASCANALNNVLRFRHHTEKSDAPSLFLELSRELFGFFLKSPSLLLHAAPGIQRGPDPFCVRHVAAMHGPTGNQRSAKPQQRPDPKDFPHERARLPVQ
jgi:hypothetical protein